MWAVKSEPHIVSIIQEVGEVRVCFSLEQSSDCFAILRNLLETHPHFPDWRPADAKEDQVLGLLRNRGIYSKHTHPSL